MTDIDPCELTAKLDRIAAYEQRFRTTLVTAFLRWVGPARAFAMIYRRVGPLIVPWLSRTTRGELAARVSGIPALLLTTTGARTGRLRVSTLLRSSETHLKRIRGAGIAAGVRVWTSGVSSATNSRVLSQGSLRRLRTASHDPGHADTGIPGPCFPLVISSASGR